MKFNINHHVKVKLTPFGLKMLRMEHYRSGATWEFKPPLADEHGYVEYQLWSLIHTFGNYINIGCEAPFETEIIIDDRSLYF